MNFFEKVYQTVNKIPPGRVATYGQIAAAIGQPHAARMVGIALAKSANSHIPWQRVINRHGMISIENLAVTKDDQAYLLRQEGIKITEDENNYYVDLNTYIVDDELLK